VFYSNYQDIDHTLIVIDVICGCMNCVVPYSVCTFISLDHTILVLK